MNIFTADREMDVAALASSLARTPRAAAAVRERLVALNPHLTDAARIPKGEVLVLPEGPDIKAGAGNAVKRTNLGELAERFVASTRASASLTGERLESIAAGRAAVRDALKTAAVKRLVDGDRLLQKQLAEVEAHFKSEQKRVTEAAAQMEKTAQLVKAEMAKLQKLVD